MGRRVLKKKLSWAMLRPTIGLFWSQNPALDLVMAYNCLQLVLSRMKEPGGSCGSICYRDFSLFPYLTNNEGNPCPCSARTLRRSAGAAEFGHNCDTFCGSLWESRGPGPDIWPRPGDRSCAATSLSLGSCHNLAQWQHCKFNASLGFFGLKYSNIAYIYIYYK